MGPTRFQNGLARKVERTLAALPSPLAQLVFFSSLRDLYTATFLHEGWAEVASPLEVDAAARAAHARVFYAILETRLPVLCRQLKEHFDATGTPTEGAAQVWLEMEPFRALLPGRCSPLERLFFISQLRAALQVLAQSPDLSCLGEPAASPPLRPVPLPPPPRGG